MRAAILLSSSMAHRKDIKQALPSKCTISRSNDLRDISANPVEEAVAASRPASQPFAVVSSARRVVNVALTAVNVLKSVVEV